MQDYDAKAIEQKWQSLWQGERVFKLDGKALRIRKTILFRDMDGHELCKIQERMLHLRDSMEIEGPDGNRMAMVHKAMISPLRERWIAKLEERAEADPIFAKWFEEFRDDQERLLRLEDTIGGDDDD